MNVGRHRLTQPPSEREPDRSDEHLTEIRFDCAFTIIASLTIEQSGHDMPVRLLRSRQGKLLFR